MRACVCLHVCACVSESKCACVTDSIMCVIKLKHVCSAFECLYHSVNIYACKKLYVYVLE